MKDQDKRLGGPNADVPERIEAMKRPKLIQSPLCPACRQSHQYETTEILGMTIRSCPTLARDEAVVVQDFPPKRIYERIDFGEKRKFL